ncbi:MAG: NADH-quinone oxidoreductase subunit N [Gemmatimonadota bacterium]
MVEPLDAWTALLPVILLAVTALVLFGLDSLRRQPIDHRLLTGTAALGTILALAVSVWYLAVGVGDPDDRGVIELFADTIVVDQMALWFTIVVGVVTLLVVLASHDYLGNEPHRGEFYSLVLLAATGMATMAAANSLVTAFIALELASLPSYALVAFFKGNRGSVEGGLKYFLIGALSSSIFVYGISLVYGATGALQFDAVAAGLSADHTGLLALGLLFVVGGVAFKTASVPFHFWAPDAYVGAPAPVAAFVSSASKAAGFVIAFRIFVEAFPLGVVLDMGVDWVFVFQVLAVVTMTLGNLAAATQTEVKRMLAYSSIGHAGYVLIALAALTDGGLYNDLVLGAGMLHLLVYGVMNTGAFLFVALVEYWDLGRGFDDLNGLGRRAPILSVAMTVLLFNLAGLPVGGGFLTKYVLFAGAVSAGFWWLAAVGALNSALSLFYYSRIVKAMWIEEPDEDMHVGGYPLGLYAVVIAAAVLTVVALPAFGPLAEAAIDAAGTLLA